jgi:hypothetical protein
MIPVVAQQAQNLAMGAAGPPARPLGQPDWIVLAAQDCLEGEP